MLLNQKTYRYFGANYWYGMHLGAGLQPGHKERLIKELDHLKSVGVNNLRIMATSQGPNDQPFRVFPALEVAPGKYQDSILLGLDFLLHEMSKRDMKAVVCLSNMWPWTGGFAQYRAWSTGEKIPYPPPAKKGSWLKYISFTSKFFKDQKALRMCEGHVKKIVNRVNSITHKPYKQDPAIMAWQLANEPRKMGSKKAYYNWVNQTSSLIQKLDTNHLVSVGSEGNAFMWWSKKFKKEHRFTSIDYCTAHIWVQNWKWYKPEKHSDQKFEKVLRKASRYVNRHQKTAQKMHKPLVLDEFGLARDQGEFSDQGTTQRRDQFFSSIYKHAVQKGIQQFNFWGYSGYGRPSSPRAIWQQGDDFIGDPAFEHQGWYAVYDTDHSTLNTVKKINEWMELIE